MQKISEGRQLARLSESSFELFSAKDYVCKALCLVEELALCLDRFWEGGSGAQCEDHMSAAKLGSMAQCIGATKCKILKSNKGYEAVGGRSPTLG